jgi:hypothetical protein
MRHNHSLTSYRGPIPTLVPCSSWRRANLPIRAIHGFMFAACSVVAQAADFMSPGLSPAELQEQLATAGAPLVVDVRKPVEYQ